VSDEAVLDNPAWYALTTAHAPFALGEGLARRYASDVSVFGAIAEPSRAAWADLATATAGGSVVLLSAVHGHPPPEWTRHGGGAGDQMVLGALAPVAPIDADIVALSRADVPQMVALVQLAQPGPFAARTVDLGGYLGVFDAAGTLLAMAGQRMQAPSFTEISAVCTHPSARGRGLAAALTHRVAAEIVGRGQRPILHVAHGNDNAKRVYERLGFVTRRVMRVDVVAPPAPAA
jgi:GNAT superfamily N-acetyltransferase